MWREFEELCFCTRRTMSKSFKHDVPGFKHRCPKVGNHIQLKRCKPWAAGWMPGIGWYAKNFLHGPGRLAMLIFFLGRLGEQCRHGPQGERPRQVPLSACRCSSVKEHLRPVKELDAGEIHQIFAEANAVSHLGNVPSQQKKRRRNRWVFCLWVRVS